MEDAPISDYEEKLYAQMEELKDKLKFWQDRYLASEQQLSNITIKYNQACVDIQHLKAKK